MKSFSVTTQINADAQTIWSVLIDNASYPEWNTTVAKVEGKIALGELIKIYTHLESGKTFAVKVLEFVPPNKMVWQAGMPLGLFKGVRMFHLSHNADGSTEFQMREDFLGLLAPLITPSIPNLTPSFETFAACLKAQAESMAME